MVVGRVICRPTGNSPGVVKPDFVEFGGCLQRPFIVLNEGKAFGLEATEGTSFSAPSVLRLGAGLRAHFGDTSGKRSSISSHDLHPDNVLTVTCSLQTSPSLKCQSSASSQSEDVWLQAHGFVKTLHDMICKIRVWYSPGCDAAAASSGMRRSAENFIRLECVTLRQSLLAEGRGASPRGINPRHRRQDHCCCSDGWQQQHTVPRKQNCDSARCVEHEVEFAADYRPLLLSIAILALISDLAELERCPSHGDLGTISEILG